MILNLITKTFPPCRLLGPKNLHITSKVYSAEQSPLFKLRQKTGLAYNLCREALNKHDNNVQEAEAWLKAQALAHGLQKATKVRGRSAREGLICLAVEHQNRLASLLELNCETDFVAKNEVFRDFAIDLTEQFASTKQNCNILKSQDHSDHIQILTPAKAELDKLDEQIVPLITKLGENIRIQRAFHYKVADDDAKVYGQIHAQAGQKSYTDVNIITGRFGALVAIKDLNQQASESRDATLKMVGNRLCQHVIGYSPTYIELPDNVRKHLEEADRERLDREKQMKLEEASKEDGEENDDSADMDESIQSDTNSRDDWPSIMDQTLIMSDDVIVRDFCKENKISLLYFNRFECGEQS